MKRLDAVSPAMRHRVGGLVDQYQSVMCDCGTEFVARPGGVARCPACGRTDVPAIAAVADAVVATLARSKELDAHLSAAADAAREQPMTTTHKVRGIARLVQNFHAMNDAAEKLADEMEKHATRVTESMKTTRAVVAQVAQAADEIEAANALFTNGGEPLDQGSAGTSSGQAAAATSAGQ
jgi:methyl-accepting chemotaxis protein